MRYCAFNASGGILERWQFIIYMEALFLEARAEVRYNALGTLVGWS